MINFLNGKPGLDLLPIDLFRKASMQALSAPDAVKHVLQYGHEYGNEHYLKRLAEFLSHEYGSPVESQHLCATPGASLGLQHIISLLTRPSSVTRFAYFQDPTYHLVFDTFTDIGFEKNQFVGVRDDNDGLDTNQLAQLLAEHFPTPSPSNSPFYDAVLYCVPSHANPTSSILSHERRQELVRLARLYNVLVICDDVYDLLTYEGTIPKRLVAYDLDTIQNEEPVVISNGSFSKLLAPGCRAGWIEAHPTLIKRLGACGSFYSGGTPSNLANEILSPMLVTTDSELCLSRHIGFLKTTLKHRLDHGLWAPIQQQLVPLGCTARLPTGGYFVWLRLPDGIDCEGISKTIVDLKLEIEIGPGWLFVVHRANFKNYIRLCFAHYPAEILQEGIQRLAVAIRATMAASQQQPLQAQAQAPAPAPAPSQ